jgi:hypothetical protein
MVNAFSLKFFAGVHKIHSGITFLCTCPRFKLMKELLICSFDLTALTFGYRTVRRFLAIRPRPIEICGYDIRSCNTHNKYQSEFHISIKDLCYFKCLAKKSKWQNRGIP